SHIAGDEDADGGGFEFETVDALLLFDIGETAVQHGDVLRFQVQCVGEGSGEPFQGGDAFGEHHRAHIRLRAYSDLPQALHECGLFAGRFGEGFVVEVGQGDEGG